MMTSTIEDFSMPTSGCNAMEVCRKVFNGLNLNLNSETIYLCRMTVGARNYNISIVGVNMNNPSMGDLVNYIVALQVLDYILLRRSRLKSLVNERRIR